MGISKLIKELTTWTKPSDLHWIEVQNDKKEFSEKARLDENFLKTVGLVSGSLGVVGSNTIDYVIFPLPNNKNYVTVSVSIEPETFQSSQTPLPVGARPKHLIEHRTFFSEGFASQFNVRLREDRLLLGRIQVNDAGVVSILNQHTFPRSFSITFISEK